MQKGPVHLGCFGPCSHQYADSECSDKFFACLRDAFNSPGTKFDGACHLCLGEFSIHLTSEKLVIRTWRDLGDLSSDRVWLEQADETEGWYPDRDPREIRSRYKRGWASK